MSRGGHTSSPIREATPPHPRTSSLYVSRTLHDPATLRSGPVRARAKPFPCARACVYACAREQRIYTRLCVHHRRWTLRKRTHTRSHVAKYRKAEIDNAGGPPAPYPNTDTRPAVAPGPSRRRDGALPSSLPFGFCAEHIRPVSMQQINPTLRIHTCAFDATRMLVLLDSRQCWFLLERRLLLRSRWLIILTDVGCSISVTVLAVPVAKWRARKERRGRRSTRRGGRPCVGLATWYCLATRFSSSSWQKFHTLSLCLPEIVKLFY